MGDLDEPHRDAIALVSVLHALSDPTRLAVVGQLDASGETLCGQLDVSVAKSTLSQHLRVLREAGVTHTRPSGGCRSVVMTWTSSFPACWTWCWPRRGSPR
jgi:predicted transcriptional regulator